MHKQTVDNVEHAVCFEITLAVEEKQPVSVSYVAAGVAVMGTYQHK